MRGVVFFGGQTFQTAVRSGPALSLACGELRGLAGPGGVRGAGCGSGALRLRGQASRGSGRLGSEPRALPGGEKPCWGRGAAWAALQRPLTALSCRFQPPRCRAAGSCP